MSKPKTVEQRARRAAVVRRYNATEKGRLAAKRYRAKRVTAMAQVALLRAQVEMLERELALAYQGVPRMGKWGAQP